MMESKVKGKEMKVGEKKFAQHLVGFEPTYYEFMLPRQVLNRSATTMPESPV